MFSQSTIELRVKEILKEYPLLHPLNQKKRLIWYYWTKYDGLKAQMGFEDFLRLTDEESIVRARRKVLSDERYEQIEALVKRNEFRDHYKQKQTYAI